MKAFLRKEWMEWNRTGRTMVLLAVFAADQVYSSMHPNEGKGITDYQSGIQVTEVMKG